MNVTKEQMREIKELKNAVGRIMEGANGTLFMCVLTSLIGDAGVQWSYDTPKREFIAETVEAISMWYDWYEKELEDEDE
jgi:hypothetical protein